MFDSSIQRAGFSVFRLSTTVRDKNMSPVSALQERKLTHQNIPARLLRAAAVHNNTQQQQKQKKAFLHNRTTLPYHDMSASSTSASRCQPHATQCITSRMYRIT